MSIIEYSEILCKSISYPFKDPVRSTDLKNLYQNKISSSIRSYVISVQKKIFHQFWRRDTMQSLQELDVTPSPRTIKDSIQSNDST